MEPIQAPFLEQDPTQHGPPQHTEQGRVGFIQDLANLGQAAKKQVGATLDVTKGVGKEVVNSWSAMSDADQQYTLYKNLLNGEELGDDYTVVKGDTPTGRALQVKEKYDNLAKLRNSESEEEQKRYKESRDDISILNIPGLALAVFGKDTANAMSSSAYFRTQAVPYGVVGGGLGAVIGAAEAAPVGAGVFSVETATAGAALGWNEGYGHGENVGIGVTSFKITQADSVSRLIEAGFPLEDSWDVSFSFSVISALSEVIEQEMLGKLMPGGFKTGIARGKAKGKVFAGNLGQVILGEDTLRRHLYTQQAPILKAFAAIMKGIGGTAATEATQESFQELMPALAEFIAFKYKISSLPEDQQQKLKDEWALNTMVRMLEAGKHGAIGGVGSHVVMTSTGYGAGRAIGSLEHQLYTETPRQAFTRNARVKRSIDNIRKVLAKEGISGLKKDRATFRDNVVTFYEQYKVGKMELQHKVEQALGAFLEGASDEQILSLASDRGAPRTDKDALDTLFGAQPVKSGETFGRTTGETTFTAGITYEEQGNLNTPLAEVAELNSQLNADLKDLGKSKFPGYSIGAKLRKAISGYVEGGESTGSSAITPSLLTQSDAGMYAPSFFAKRAVVQASEDRIQQLETERALLETQVESEALDRYMEGDTTEDPVMREIEDQIEYHQEIIRKVENDELTPSEIYAQTDGIRGTASLDSIIQEELFNFNRGVRAGKSEARHHYEDVQKQLITAIKNANVDDKTKAAYLARVKDVFVKHRDSTDAGRLATVIKELQSIAEEQRLKRAEARLERIRGKIKDSSSKYPKGKVPYEVLLTFDASHRVETTENKGAAVKALRVVLDTYYTKGTERTEKDERELTAALLELHMYNALMMQDMSTSEGKEALADYLWEVYKSGRNEWVKKEKERMDKNIHTAVEVGLTEVQGNKPVPEVGDSRPTKLINMIPRSIAAYFLGWFHDWQGRLDAISSDSSSLTLSSVYSLTEEMSTSEAINIRLRNEYEARIGQAINGKRPQFLRYLQDAGAPLSLGTYVNRDGETAEIHLSRMQIISLMIANQNPNYTSNFENGNKYTSEFWNKVESALKPEDYRVAQELSAFYADMYEVANDAWIDKHGVPLPEQSFYTPITIDTTVLKEHGHESASLIPSSSYSTVDNTLPVASTEFHSTVLRYIDQWSNFISGKEEKFEAIKAFLTNKRVKTVITSKYGPDAHREVTMAFERMMGLHSPDNGFVRFQDTVRKFFFPAVLAMKPSQMPVQATSALLAIGPHTIGGKTFRVHPQDVLDGWSRTLTSDGPQDTFSNLPFTLDRERTYAPQQSDIRFGSRSVRDGYMRKMVPDALKPHVPTSSELTNMAMFDTRFGDRMGSHGGGWAVYTKAIEAGIPHEVALDYINNWMETTQQSTRADKLSNMQLDPNTKIWTDFLNAPMQQARWAYRAMLEASKTDIRTSEGRIAHEKAFINTMTGMVLIPFLINTIRTGIFLGPLAIGTAVLTGLPLGEEPPEDDEWDRKLQDIFAASVIDGFNALPLWGGLIAGGFDVGYDAALKLITGEGSTQGMYPYKASSPAIQFILDKVKRGTDGIAALGKGDGEKAINRGAEAAILAGGVATNTPWAESGIDRLMHIVAYLQGQENLPTTIGGWSGLSDSALKAQGGAAPKSEIIAQTLLNLVEQMKRQGEPINPTEDPSDFLYKDTSSEGGGGMIEPGNIDLHSRPVVKNPDGSISTVRSISVGYDGVTYLIPTVAKDGSGILSDKEAKAQFKETGEHLGIFTTPEAADNFGRDVLHPAQEKMYSQTPR